MGKAVTLQHIKLPLLLLLVSLTPLAWSVLSDFLFAAERKAWPRFDFDAQILQHQPGGEIVSIRWLKKEWWGTLGVTEEAERVSRCCCDSQIAQLNV